MGALPAPDPSWLFSDNGQTLFQYFRYCDTSRIGDYNCFALESDQILDTGVTYNGSKYINLNYQFSSDTFRVFDEFDETVIQYQDYRPGVAGFKTAWDYGMTGYPLARYKYLVFAHKGPNSNHKVTVKTWYNNGECGAPSFQETLGEFSGSEVWKLDTIVIPDAIRNKPESDRNSLVYFELVFIITNLNPADTTSGAPGNLKVDDIRLTGLDLKDEVKTESSGGGCGAGTGLAFIPPLIFKEVTRRRKKAK
ncbi:MAG: hypothetical protein GX556_12445 [Fibrobacter sp.]|nr:hypothetical protein [Fibrobacter sp.]